MDFLIDLLPAVLFYAAYSAFGLYTATAVLIASCFVLVIVKWLRTRRIPWFAVAVAVIVAVLGGITLKLHDPIFIQYKPTIVYIALALGLLASQLIGDTVLVARMPKEMVALPEFMWRRINLAWAGFFTGCAALNVYVVDHFGESVWVSFHSFGFPVLTFIFTLLHLPFLLPYLQDEPGGEQPNGSP